MSTGVCVKWYPKRSYGFIHADGAASADDLFVHITGIKDRTIEDGQRVQFEIASHNGRPVAVNVEPEAGAR